MDFIKPFYKFATLSVVLMLVSIVTYSQPGTPPGDPTDPTVPITGIEILVAIGGVLGIKKLIGSSKEKIN
jgi:hypothetical protein